MKKVLFGGFVKEQRTARYIVICLGAILAAGPLASAAIIFSSYPKVTSASGDDVYGAGSETFQQSVAALFIPNANYTFTSATLGLFLNTNDVNDNDFTVSINADAGGVPGAAIETFADIDATTDDTTDLTLNSVLQPTLVSGDHYWLVAIADGRNTQGLWSLAGPSVAFGDTASSSNGGTNWTPAGAAGNLPAFEIDGVVPEPSSLGLLALAALATARRRRSP